MLFATLQNEGHTVNDRVLCVTSNAASTVLIVASCYRVININSKSADIDLGMLE